MSTSQPNEDLFDDSRMTFGEHLEELRKVLLRALVGVAIMCILGFVLAEEVVQMLNEPLVKAQNQFEEEDAENRLKAEFGYVPPEYLPLLEEGFVPRAGYVDPGQLISVLQSKIPDLGEQLDLEPYGFQEDQFIDDQITTLAQRLVDREGDADVAKLTAVWELLNEDERSTLTGIANSPSLQEREQADALQAVIQMFNRISKLDQLYLDPAFEPDLTVPGFSWKTFLNQKQANPLADLKDVAESPETSEIDRPNVQRRLNRALLISLFSEQTLPVRLDVKPFDFWEQVDYKPQALGVSESFFVWLKAGLFTGLTFAGPWVFYQLWSFVAAGLYPHEKKYIHWFLPISIVLFIGGVLLAFFYVFEPVLAFLFSFNRAMGIAPEMRIGEWLSFAMFLPLGFGVAFQLPLVMLFANRVGLIEISTYVKNWRIAVMVIFILAMFLTPADPISLLLLAIPLTCLYFLGIGMCKWMPKPQNPYGDSVPPAN